VLDRLQEVNFEGLIDALIGGGWVEFFFPFLLIYAIVLTIMNRAEVFKGNKATRVIIALVFALFSTIFPVSETCDVDVVKHMGYCTLGTYMSAMFPGVSMFAIGVLCLYIIAALLGKDLTSFMGDSPWILYILGALGALVVGWQWASAFFEFGGGSSSDFWLVQILQDPILYVLVLFVLLFWWISKEDDPNYDYSSGSSGTTVNVGNNNGGNP